MCPTRKSIIRVLFVEDDPADARLIRVFLQRMRGIGPVELEHADRLETALALLRQASFDVVLLDLSLPDSSGFGTLLRVQQAAPDTAVVVLTGLDDPDFAIEAVHAGAQDYLVKGQGDGLLIYRSLLYATERKRLEQELIKATRQATAANQRKSQFLAAMSHELRTPLNAILGFSEMIKEQILGPCGNPRYVDYARDIFTAGIHLLGLINDILDLSKVEAGRMQLLEEEIDIPRLVAECLEMVAETARNRGLTLRREEPEGRFRLRGDARLLRQILLNLLSNSLKFTPSGGSISVHLERSAGAAVIQIRDTGIGIAAEAMERVIEEFQQADITVARDHGGTGLGLPLSRRFMALHGGELVLESQVGAGTTATLRFPPERCLD